jgi:hypothetical protein
MGRGNIVTAQIKFLRAVYNLTISGDQCPKFCLDKTIHLAGLIKKGRFESFCREM